MYTKKIDISISYFSEVQNPTSKYNGVSRHKATKKWKAELTHNQKIYYGGLFDIEEQAAREVNLLCDKCKIDRRNTMINMEQDPIQQVIHSLSIIYKKVK